MATQFWGWGLLLIAGLCMKFGRLPKARNWLFLISGFLLLYSFAGWLGGLVVKGLNLGAPILARIKGFHPEYVLPLLAIFVIFLAIHSLHPKKGKPATWHGPVFFLLAAVLVAAGGAFSQLAGSGQGLVTDLTTTVLGMGWS